MSTFKQSFSITIGIILTAMLVFYAATTSAGNPASPNPGGFPANNTPFPVTVGSYFQIKGSDSSNTGGGLAVEAFIAQENASFSKDVGVQGILTGNPVDATNSNLNFGGGGKTVTVQTTGWTYARDGSLYTPKENSLQAGAVMPLCANNDGEIITCPNESPIIP